MLNLSSSLVHEPLIHQVCYRNVKDCVSVGRRAFSANLHGPGFTTYFYPWISELLVNTWTSAQCKTSHLCEHGEHEQSFWEFGRWLQVNTNIQACIGTDMTWGAALFFSFYQLSVKLSPCTAAQSAVLHLISLHITHDSKIQTSIKSV